VRLTERQRQVVEGVAAGKRYRDIAAELGIATMTAKNHMSAACLVNSATPTQLARQINPDAHLRAKGRPVSDPHSACPHCRVGNHALSGYHEIPDPASLGGFAWVACQTEGAT
jgi:hypothetical protein